MRHSVPAALVAILFAVQAAAQDGKDHKKKGGEKETAGSLADSADPVDEETSDDGRFTPKGKTGKLKPKTKKQKEAEIVEVPRKKFNLFADILAVWGTPPEPDAQPIYDASESVTAYGFVVGGSYDIKPNFTFGIRIPFSRANIDATRLFDITLDGSSNALGNPDFMGQYRIKLSPGAYVPIDFGVAAPFAQGDPDPTSSNHPAVAKAMVNRTMDAGTGWLDSELYYVGRVPVKIGVGYLQQRLTWNVYAKTKLVAAPKIRGALELEGDLPQPNNADVDEYQYNPVALRNITVVGAGYNPWAGLWLNADAWLGINIFDELDRISQATPPSAFQFVVEPGLGYDLDFLKLNISYIKPLGGRLQDIQGARLTAEMGF